MAALLEANALSTIVEPAAENLQSITVPAKVAELLTFMQDYWWLFAILAVWVLIWKGCALWKAAKNGSKPWFVVLLLVNTVGILEILYIFVFGKKGKK